MWMCDGWTLCCSTDDGRVSLWGLYSCGLESSTATPRRCLILNLCQWVERWANQSLCVSGSVAQAPDIHRVSHQNPKDNKSSSLGDLHRDSYCRPLTLCARMMGIYEKRTSRLKDQKRAKTLTTQIRLHYLVCRHLTSTTTANMGLQRATV